MEDQEILLGAIDQGSTAGNASTGTPAAGYDNSGVNPDAAITPAADTTTTDQTSSSNPWLLYLGGALVFYYLILKKK